jgi:hypothetical protein
MEIHEDEVWDRAVSNGMNQYASSPYEIETAEGFLVRAKAELEQEHLEYLFNIHSEAVQFITEFEDNPSEIAWFLMKGMTDDDEGVCFDRALYFGPWEITWRKGQWWMFENMHRNSSMFDVDLLTGLRIIEEVENENV